MKDNYHKFVHTCPDWNDMLISPNSYEFQNCTCFKDILTPLGSFDIIDYQPWHQWGDKWFQIYGNLLSAAEKFIKDYVQTHSFYYLVCKEKYGTIRYEHLFPKGCLNKLELNNYWSTGLSKLQYKHGKWILRKAIKKACKKFPQVKNEILDDYDEEWL